MAGMKDYPNGQLLVTPEQLEREIESRKLLLVLDLRPPEAYTAGHVPGATHIDLWGVSLIDTDPAPLKAFMWMIEHVLAIHGVKADTPIVVYDEQSGVHEPRGRSGSSSISDIQRSAFSTADSAHGPAPAFRRHAMPPRRPRATGRAPGTANASRPGARCRAPSAAATR